MVKNPPASVRDMGSVPGSGRSPREGNGNLLQFFTFHLMVLEFHTIRTLYEALCYCCLVTQ